MGANYYLLKPNSVEPEEDYDMVHDEDELFIHIGRSTNGGIIWNIDPFSLPDYQKDGYKPYYEDHSEVTWYELWYWIYTRDEFNDFEYVGKNVKFF